MIKNLQLSMPVKIKIGKKIIQKKNIKNRKKIIKLKEIKLSRNKKMFQNNWNLAGWIELSISNIKNKIVVALQIEVEYQLQLWQKKLGDIVNLMAMIVSIVYLRIKEIDANRWRQKNQDINPLYHPYLNYLNKIHNHALEGHMKISSIASLDKEKVEKVNDYL